MHWVVSRRRIHTGILGPIVAVMADCNGASRLLTDPIVCALESKNDGAVEADDSEDDWTFNDYRTGGAEQSKEESMGEADVSSVVEVRNRVGFSF